MQAIPRSPFVRFVVVPLTLTAFLAGCASSPKWTRIARPYEANIAEAEPEAIRVLQRDFALIELGAPIVTRDTLFGNLVGSRDTLVCYGDTCELRHLSRAAIPVEEIMRLEARDDRDIPGWGKGLIAVGGLLFFGLLVYAATQLPGDPVPSGRPGDPIPLNPY